MIIVGERLNSARKPILEALQKKNEAFLLDEAVRQQQAGADFIDLNAAALMDDEIPSLAWAIPLLQKAVSIPLSIDSPNPEAIEAGLKIHNGRALLNSLTGESRRMERLLPLIRDHKPKVIALCLDDNGIPNHADAAAGIAARMLDSLTGAGLAAGDVFMDPLVRPIATDAGVIRQFLENLDKLRIKLPEVMTIAGLSNVSFGLPLRKLINRTLLVLAIGHGLQAVICDPLDDELQASLKAAQALVGRDSAMKNYLSFIRNQKRRGPTA